MQPSSPPNSRPDSRDRQWLQRCLDLARKASGQTAPNPCVGAVIVQGDEVVGEGFHPGAGRPHAEVIALQVAGDRAAGGTLYVNLEPCNHCGRTPPCTEAVSKAGIRRVVVGMVDPDPRVAGQGIERLRTAGIDVTVGVLESACLRLNEAFCHRVMHQRPLGILKYAMTLDGKIATSTGHSAWVTSPAARHRVHQLRAECDAVIIGGNTVRLDNPLLTTHGVGDRNPRRVIMSQTLSLPIEAQIWDVNVAPTVVMTSTAARSRQADVAQALVDRGVEMVDFADFTPDAVACDLAQRGCNQVLWECGGTLAAAAIQADCVQRLWAFVAPKLIGGTQAPGPIADLGHTQMTAAIALHEVTCEAIAPDWLWDGYLRPPIWAQSSSD